MNGLVVVIGGSGALGKAFISHFNSLNYKTVSVDFVENSAASVNSTPSAAISDLSRLSPADLIVNAAGGWAGGDAADPEFQMKCKKMWEMNVESSVLAASLAAKMLKKPAGLLVLVGAKAVAVHSTPEMLAYAMSKSAVASLAANMAINSGFPVTLLLPEVLDTEANRMAMPDADTSKWTPVHLIAEKVAEFMESGPEAVNGKSWLISTRAGVTNFTEKQ